MKAPRWQTIAESEFPWEREAIEWLMEKLPDHEPWHAWSNFEFIDDDGKVNEVDVLVLAPAGLFLIEIKSRPGVLRGDAHTWTWTTDGREYSYDNPLFLANRKAKRLRSLLRKQPSFVKARERMPWVEPAIFLSAKDLKCLLDGRARAQTFLRGRPGHPEDDGIVAAVHAFPNIGSNAPQRVDAKQARAIVRAMAEAGIRPSTKHRQVGDYRLGSLLTEGINYQDWSAKHVSVETKRRIRIYSYAKASTPEARQSLARQAKREFQVLEGIDHSGILKVLDYKDTELGPALIFEPDNGAVRLDHFIQRKHAELDIGQRLQILRDLTDTLRYAHSKRLYHRALSPTCVLVRVTNDVDRPLRLQIMNWQTGARDGTGSNATLHTVGTQHVDDYVEDPSRVYLAPEATQLAPAGVLLDVFALGAVAHFVLAGKPPASDTIELMDKLRRGPGLRLSDALDGAAKHLQDLVALSTHPDVSARISSMEEFSEYLELAEDELTAPEPEQWVDPAVAKKDDRIAGGFTMVKRLGRGSSADVLLVKRDGSDQELVLKVATDSRYNDRLVDEADTLSKLTHQNIVKYVDTLEVNGRRAILMHKAGESSLAHEIRKNGKPSLDMLRRFGDELLSVLVYLEERGVAHRDIKPDNIGIGEIGSGKKTLLLFDFSLSRTSPENIQAGTTGYLDPFLRSRKPPRWDLYAERYAAAVTLYEMATGALPVWGDNNSAPDVLDCEVTLNTDAFDPNLREGLTAFFEKTLRRDYRERFDNAEEMLREWRHVFDSARRPDTTPDVFDAVARLATANTTISELGYSVEAQSVLDRMGIHNVRELLAVERIKFRYLKGVSDKVRKEIRLTAKRLAQLRPDLIPGRPTTAHDDESAAAAVSLDEVAAQLLPKRPAGDDRSEDQAIALYLGLDGQGEEPDWLPLGKAASDAKVTRSAVANALVRLRERWLKLPQVTELRDEIAALLPTHGNVMTPHELAKALLLARGSVEQDESTRVRLGLAVARACVEAEQQREPRFQVFDHTTRLLIATTRALADFANRLGEAADRLAQQDPLLSPTTALRELEDVKPPEGLPPLLPHRLVKLAAAASKNAALSSRSELYPIGMSAAQAIRHSLGALTGPQRLTERELHERVRGRFPLCAPLPTHPELDRVLNEAGLDLIWQAASGEHEAAYVPQALTLSVGSTTQYHRHATQTVLPSEVSTDVAAARAFEERIAHLIARGGFLALTTTLRGASRVAHELTSRFGMQEVSFDELLLDAMLEQASALGIETTVLLEADRAAPASVDRRNLLRLVSRSAALVKETLLRSEKPLLITEPGLLARYDLMSLVSELQSAAGRPQHTPAIVLLVPMVQPDAPAIDGVIVPTITAAQWAKAPEAWIENRHRSALA